MTTTMTPATAADANGDLTAKGYAAFARGDMAFLGQVFSPDIIWHAQRLGQLSGDHVGFPAVMQFFGRSMELTGGTFQVGPTEILANDQGAAAVVRSQGNRDGSTLDDRQIHHFRIRDGRVTEVWQYVGDPEAVNAFWR